MWVVGYVLRWFSCPQTITHPRSNWVRHKATSLIDTSVLPLAPNRHRISCVCLCFQACWVLNSFAEVKFKNIGNLRTALDVIRNILSNDREIPVRIEAATALQQLLSEQEKGLFQFNLLPFGINCLSHVPHLVF